MRDTAASRNNLLPYPVITAAVQGDPDAVNRVIGHYSGLHSGAFHQDKL